MKMWEMVKVMVMVMVQGLVRVLHQEATASWGCFSRQKNVILKGDSMILDANNLYRPRKSPVVLDQGIHQDSSSLSRVGLTDRLTCCRILSI